MYMLRCMFGVVEMGSYVGLLIQKEETGSSKAFSFAISCIFTVFLIFAITMAFYTYREYKAFMQSGEGAMGGMPMPGAGARAGGSNPAAGQPARAGGDNYQRLPGKPLNNL
jgi:hypothetical protein